MDSIEKLNAAVTLIEEARGVPLSASCVVHRGEILEILDGARLALPTDLDQAIQIILQLLNLKLVPLVERESLRVLIQGQILLNV